LDSFGTDVNLGDILAAYAVCKGDLLVGSGAVLVTLESMLESSQAVANPDVACALRECIAELRDSGSPRDVDLVIYSKHNHDAVDSGHARVDIIPVHPSKNLNKTSLILNGNIINVATLGDLEKDYTQSIHRMPKVNDELIAKIVTRMKTIQRELPQLAGVSASQSERTCTKRARAPLPLLDLN
jgi:hypothetical protein